MNVVTYILKLSSQQSKQLLECLCDFITETSSFCTDPLTGLMGVATSTPARDGFTNGELGTAVVVYVF